MRTREDIKSDMFNLNIKISMIESMIERNNELDKRIKKDLESIKLEYQTLKSECMQSALNERKLKR